MEGTQPNRKRTRKQGLAAEGEGGEQVEVRRMNRQRDGELKRHRGDERQGENAGNKKTDRKEKGETTLYNSNESAGLVRPRPRSHNMRIGFGGPRAARPRSSSRCGTPPGAMLDARSSLTARERSAPRSASAAQNAESEDSISKRFQRDNALLGAPDFDATLLALTNHRIDNARLARHVGLGH